MSLAVYSDNRRFQETSFEGDEEKLEQLVKQSPKLLFGPKSIYIDLKNKVQSKELGGAIPDGFLFDLNDKDDPQFYLVEVELQEHDFWKHIFPQITKYFAFYNNSKSRTKLVEKLFEFIHENSHIRDEFRQFLAGTELYKSIKDVLDNSQNILLIADETLPQVREIQETYTDTWGKFVVSAVLKEFSDGGKRILILNPSFDELKDVENALPPSDTGEESRVYNESYHLRDVSPEIIQAYYDIKEHMSGLNEGIVLNPQHYYISIRKNRNFAYIKVRKNQIRIVVSLPIEEGKAIVKNQRVRELTKPVQTWYGTPCFELLVENTHDLADVFAILERAYKDSES
jgi:predicted transport protein